MRLIVLSYKGAPPTQPIQAEFGQSGGSIGREPGNVLVLPDPERHISRLHANVFWERGVFLIEDHGGNPTLINGRPVGRGNRAAIANGDTLTIGSYELRADVPRAIAAPAAAPAASATPASDPLGLFGEAPAAPPAFGPGSAADPYTVPPPAPAAHDLFGGVQAPPSPAPRAAPAPVDDPFAVFMAATPAAAAPAPAAPAVDLPDPFAPKPAVAARPAPLGMDLPLAPDTSVDDLFGIAPATASSDPFAGTPLSAHSAPPAAAPVAEDPLALFGAAPAAQAVAAPVRDDAPLLAESFPLPQAAAPIPAAAPAAPAAAAHAPAGIVVSWSETPGQAAPSRADHDERLAPRASPGADIAITRDTVPGLAPAPAGVPPAPAAAIPAPPASMPQAPVSPALPAAAPGPAADALLAAFQCGLGFPLQPADGLSPERMEQIGRVLREAVAGTMALLTARALTKREIRAEVTMIVSKENNPLKFAPDVQFALVQLLAPQGRGFMEPVTAMRDAYDDLRSHQFGFMAGMRAALSGVLGRFKPEELEGRIASRGFLDSVLPGGRKARLWDLYEQHYADISREAEDDFHALFGRAFLKAYEEQIDRLAAEPGRE